MEIILRLHFWIGAIGLIVFLLTGQYMDIYHEHLVGMEDGKRMLYRSSHIYFLLVCILNLSISLSPQVKEGRLITAVKFAVSAIILVSPALVLFGFFIEPTLNELERPYSRLAVYLLFAASIGLLFLKVIRRKT